MNNKLSHGFLEKIIDRKCLSSVKKECLFFIKQQNNCSNYYKISDNNSINSKRLINSNLLSKVINLLDDPSPNISAIELHVQKSFCDAIPPHQDNFYHCVNPEDSLKVLIPLQYLDESNGGLIFFDSEYDYPILEHLPSSQPNFSAYINNSTLTNINLETSSYSYKKGDASFHYINSIHYSNGNRTNNDSLFIVFRFEKKSAKIIVKNKLKYEKCYQSHLQLMDN